MEKKFRSLKAIRRHYEKGSKEILKVAPRLDADGGSNRLYVLSKWRNCHTHMLNFYIEICTDYAKGVPPHWEAVGTEQGSLQKCLKALKSELDHVYMGVDF